MDVDRQLFDINKPQDVLDRSSDLATFLKSAKHFLEQVVTNHAEEVLLEQTIRQSRELRAHKIAEYQEKLNEMINESNLELEGSESFPTLEQWMEKNNEAVAEFRQLKLRFDEITKWHKTHYAEYERLREQIRQLSTTRDEYREQLQQKKALDKNEICLLPYNNSVAAVIFKNKKVSDCFVGKENIESKEDFWEDISNRCLKKSLF